MVGYIMPQYYDKDKYRQLFPQQNYWGATVLVLPQFFSVTYRYHR